MGNVFGVERKRLELAEVFLASRCSSFTSCRLVSLISRRSLQCHLSGGNLWHCTVRKWVKENLINYFGCRIVFR